MKWTLIPVLERKSQGKRAIRKGIRKCESERLGDTRYTQREHVPKEDNPSSGGGRSGWVRDVDTNDLVPLSKDGNEKSRSGRRSPLIKKGPRNTLRLCIKRIHS